ncbi:c-type cytochrome [Citreimonas salinaria]|uniref:Sulfur dehydrogenase subunit SoxD n=1 Tax=Citreimonas salinaria TaxID=321339 RepID=A0A1H3JM46_9RHOB|nr:c-type cytochrome [Citreimonas salinaria]SDY40981.1 sulfur dehydrogenase subunit SoxD [Citreimonas salinaria]
MSKSRNLYAATAVGLVLTFTAAANFADRNIAPMPANPRLLTALPIPDPAPLGGLVSAAHADEGGGTRFGLGREALPEEVAAWDVDVTPDGTGLPEGSGDVMTGEEVFVEKCAVCHGDFAEGVGNWPKLAGGDGTLDNADPVKTVGSYWPYLSTVWDYVHRSMPFGNAQSLTADEVYAITAYILYSNFLVEDDFVLSRENFTEIEMPNRDGFFVDDRPQTEYAQWRTEPCMENCKDSVEITMRATVLDVTPDDPSGDAPLTETEAAVATPVVETAPDEAEAKAQSASAEEGPADAPDPELIAAGEAVFRQCSACHQVGEGAKNRMGPQLNAIVGREIGGVEDFRYSSAMADMDGTWDHDTLTQFLTDPRGTVPGTKMAFAGVRDQEDVKALIAYLESLE